MLRILTKDMLETDRRAFDEMFRARAAVFRDRLGWQVDVRDQWERDRYDEAEDPVYLVTQQPSGTLTGSLRLLPTTGATMLKSEFRHFFDQPIDVDSPTTWECTRFCLHPHAGDMKQSRAVATELLSGLCDLALDTGIENIVGVYDVAMVAVYRRIGWRPTPLARSRPEIGKLYVGLWDVTADNCRTLRANLSRLLEQASPYPARVLVDGGMR
ncbi:acyl-homoserine-lactone synthase 2 (plasmid) [Rhizobium phaseoli]|uniref:Acyl-homoserine-lactone synthase n=3 Tax=Rhizobium TaxID=379 RepID=RAII_RHIET|nr:MULTISPECIES: acyl-homoserine-lactone synthase [Rhizobium]O54451.1 RecName: Full=Acyl-homoserine-lactone synthase; AltName: Full=Autoinducer synthesis protein RaiI [Rhizobium etli]ACE94740.1 autoinducer synthesis protein [Rhizobium etli CIAT 652]EGE60196.1 autoinducer synthesis protein [Rhizobium etli CNPAF512]AAC38172.1 RaiI [Rhizobium etli]ANL50836.1 acyl-homoserine-lactone synthase 2 [Rhizobium phaseoli]ANM08183.1 acyl-homoserine-lactone synthase 2 [Rhizobium phaseoli]